MLGRTKNAKNLIFNKYNGFININGEIKVDFSSGKIPTGQGTTIEYNSSSGIFYFGDKAESALLGCYNEEENAFIDTVIGVNQLGEITIDTQKKSGFTYFHTVTDDVLLMKQTDIGITTNVDMGLISTENATFTGHNFETGRSYIGLSYDVMNSVSSSHNSQTMVIELDNALREREREPSSEYEKYALTMYEIYNGKKYSLTEEEKTLINNITIIETRSMLNNVDGLSQSDIDELAQDQINNIFEMAQGSIYNPVSGNIDLSSEEMMRMIEYKKQLDELNLLISME